MGGWKLGTVRGIPLRIHYSLLLALPYFMLLLVGRIDRLAQLAGVTAAQLVLPPLAWGFILSIVLFGSVFIHEAAHSVLAQRFGHRVQGITLMFIGGVSYIDHGVPETPREFRNEALIAVIGPAVSFSLAWCAALVASRVSNPDAHFALVCAGQLNFMLGFFNLLPAFPLDGGRILRALLGRFLGYERGTRAAARLGQGMAVGLGLLGFFGMNIILMIIALFLFVAAATELGIIEARRAVRGLKAGQIMHEAAPLIEAVTPVSRALTLVREGEVVAVVSPLPGAPHARIVGVIDLASLRRIPAEQRAAVPVGLAVEAIPQLRGDEPAQGAVDLLVSQGPLVAVVDEDGGLEGLIGEEDIVSRLPKKEAA